MNNQNNNFGYNPNNDMFNQGMGNNYNPNTNLNNNPIGYQNTNLYNTNVNKENISSSPPKTKKIKKILLPIIVIFVILLALFGYKLYLGSLKKNRTFIIYMVGSDLESQSKQGTYSIDDIENAGIDLKNNNVVLMAGGSKKWHNYVDSGEIGIYELKSDGFKKRKTLPLSNMGDSEVLSDFLDYAYKNYPAENYDLIFWNHGIGSIGIEQDELTGDYISVYELKNAFENSKFADNKLELTIFYNCLAGNIHFADVMSNYSDYMVASEEVLYLSRILNRLSFIGNIKNNDDAYSVAYSFIKQSDKVINEYNKSHTKELDSTLAVYDLTKIKDLKDSFNRFIETVDVDNFYYNISSVRRNLYTYGNLQSNDYDNVDMYKLVEALAPISSNRSLSNTVLNRINDTVLYLSSTNNYSNGISVYFPYYGSSKAIEKHLYTFGEIWNDSYIGFINNFYERRMGVIKSNPIVNNEAMQLENEIEESENKITLKLNEEELSKYQYANVYLFKKNIDNSYNLVLKTDKVDKTDDSLIYEFDKALYSGDNYITYDDTENVIYANLVLDDSSIDTIERINTSDKVEIVETILDSGEYPLASIIEYQDYDKISFIRNKYNLLTEDGKVQNDWKETKSKELIEADINNINLEFKDIDNYYILIEAYDIYNIPYYSNLYEVNNNEVS